MMEGYAEDMLNFAMIKAQKFSLSFTIFSLNDVTSYIRETFTLKVESKGLKLNFMFADNLSLPLPPRDRILLQSELDRQADDVNNEMKNLVLVSEDDFPRLKGDERRLKQVLLNLVKNALKFTTNGSISVALAYNSESKMLIGHVHDTGIGITQQEMSKLFSRFGKLHRSAEMNHEGIGLGLTIVKEIVTQHGGCIDIVSKGVPGEGSSFRFCMKMQAVDEDNNI